MSTNTDPLKDRDTGWYVVERNQMHVMRGPYKHAETAVAVRTEIERHMTEWQEEHWNLWIVQKRKPRAKKVKP